MHLMYSNTVSKQPLEVQCIRVTFISLECQKKHAEEVARCSSPQSTAIMKKFGDFSQVCGLQFVEQQFN